MFYEQSLRLILYMSTNLDLLLKSHLIFLVILICSVFFIKSRFYRVISVILAIDADFSGTTINRLIKINDEHGKTLNWIKCTQSALLIK